MLLAEADSVAERVRDLQRPPTRAVLLDARPRIGIALADQLGMEGVDALHPDEDGRAGAGIAVMLGEMELQTRARNLHIERHVRPETMVPVLVDLHIVDGGLYNISQAPDSMYKYGMGNYIQVFKKHHTDSLTFRKSFKYYTTNPKLMTEIYDNVVKILQAKSDSVDKVIVKPKAALPAPPTHAIPANVKPKAALPAPPTHAVPTK